MTVEHPGTQTRGAGEDRLAESTVEYVAFLTRSEHRFHVLNLLADGARSREALRDQLDATRVTLSRILGDLEDRELIRRRTLDREYELSAFGEAVHRDLVRLQDTITVGQTYPRLISRLPTDWFDFDLRCLADGEHVHGNSEDPLAAARVIANAIRGGASCESLVGTFTSLPMYGYEQAIQNGTDPEVCVVFDSNVTDTMVEDPSLRAKWREIQSQTDSIVYFSLDERVPCTVDLVDGETVFLTVDREHETGFDIISCSHPDVVAWADRVIAEYRDRAVPLADRTSDAT
ncbi:MULTISPECIES: winged helix-turn-helix domain-containing protein [Halobacterium]|uniref:helix-turn-helix transcriptional regulator n=1 Tax=Halobacterium TaxID=2239 RepID=UPI00073F8371|nr:MULTISPECIES: transcriptional regulator [Halobacterium]MCG1004761.1 transcriptional regulator [Halobacterium noricense]